MTMQVYWKHYHSRCLVPSSFPICKAVICLTRSCNLKRAVTELFQLDSHHLLLETASRMCARLPCGQCVQFFKTKKKLRRHVLLFHNPNACRCLECGKLFSEERSLEQHMGVHSKRHPAFKNSVCARLPCGQCVQFFKTKKKLRRHVLLFHNPNACRCLECGKLFSEERSLEQHMGVHSKRHPAFKNSGSVTFHCGGCAEPSCSGVQLCRREREVHDPNVHRCLKCSQVFSKQPDLIEHMRIHIKQRPYACVCPVDFQTMNGLRKHALKCSRKSKRSKKGSGGLLWAVWPEIPEDRVPRQTHPGIVVSLAAAGVTS